MAHLLQVIDLTKTYHNKTGFFRSQTITALQPINFTLEAKRNLAIVGETGSGKSTLAKLLVGAETPTDGQILLNGQQVLHGKLKLRCQHIRMIFQESGTTLNPSLTIAQLLDEPLKLNTQLNPMQREALIRETLQKVGLLADHMNFYPHMFSGGQKQRISLARALILQPQIIILDEALASLDPSLRAQMVNLLLDIQDEFGLAYILISHNIGVVRHFCDEIIVLEQGQMVDYGSTAKVLNRPKHKYTKKLIQLQQYQLLHR